jgi:sporulation protein YlmC with PRC-barrel domain
MSTRELHLELLLSRRVFDPAGKAIGRIEEIRVEPQGEEWVIKEYLVGSAALLERLSARTIGLRLLRLLGARKIYGGYRVPWDKLDLTNVDRPCLKCHVHELNPFSSPLEDSDN